MTTPPPPTRSAGRALPWGVAAACIGAVGAIVAPMMILRPFAPQSAVGVRIAFLLHDAAPWIAALGCALASLWTARRWASSGALGRSARSLVIVASGAAIWAGQVNIFERMFAPLPDPAFVRPHEATFVAPKAYVMTVQRDSDAVAFPIDQIAYHHVVNTVVAGLPIVATY
ncbi:MAG: DUF3179 domain-containing protein [Gemmatimonadaceae bacterium]|nr:DUF3179 domain-containing protein [Gemmatimonadaceae bacterium]